MGSTFYKVIAFVFPIVLVEWEDITNMAHWEDADKVLKWEDFELDPKCFSVGFLMANEEDHIVLVSQATVDFQKLAMAARIPKGCIKRIIEFEKAGPYAP